MAELHYDVIVRFFRTDGTLFDTIRMDIGNLLLFVEDIDNPVELIKIDQTHYNLIWDFEHALSEQSETEKTTKE